MLGISLAKRVNCHMTTICVLNVILIRTVPCHSYTTHAIAANSCALRVFEHPRQDYEQLLSSNKSCVCIQRLYRHECTLLANKLSKLKSSRFRWMPKLVLKSRKPLDQTQIVTSSQDKSSIRSALDVGHDVSPHACAVFVNVAESHMTYIACHRALLTYSTLLAYRHLGPFSLR